MKVFKHIHLHVNRLLVCEFGHWLECIQCLCSEPVNHSSTSKRYLYVLYEINRQRPASIIAHCYYTTILYTRVLFYIARYAGIHWHAASTYLYWQPSGASHFTSLICLKKEQKTTKRGIFQFSYLHELYACVTCAKTLLNQLFTFYL